MADTFARMRQLTGSTAEWAANNIVLGSGEIGIERVSASEYKAKVGDGTTKWSLLPYLTAPSDISSVIQAALDGKLPLAGGTMTGSLILARDGTAPKEAVTVTQLDNQVALLNTAVGGKLSTSGGTMTGPLTLAHDALQKLEPVTLSQLQDTLNQFTFSSATLTYSGTIDPTVAYAAITPVPATGSLYAVAHSGAVDPSWHAHMTNATLATVGVGDYLIWNATTSKFDYVKNAIDLSLYVPLAGTAAMTGGIAWSGAANSQSGKAIISGKGGNIDDAVIDSGTY